MKIRLLTILAGPMGSAAPGAILDVPEAEAAALLAGGFAERLAEPERAQTSALETAEAPPAPEAAVIRRGRPARPARPAKPSA